MIYTSVTNFTNNKFSLDNIGSFFNSFSLLAKDKILSILWKVRNSVSIILEIDSNNYWPEFKYSIVDNYNQSVTKIAKNDYMYEKSSDNKEKLTETISGNYIYENKKWRKFYLKIKNSKIIELDAKDWKKVSIQQKSAIQRLLNQKSLSRFQELNVKNVVTNEDLRTNLKVEKTNDSIITNNKFDFSNKINQETLSEAEINRRVKIKLDEILHANIRNKAIIDVYAKLKNQENILFMNNSAQNLSVAKKVVKELSQMVPKTNEKVVNIQVNKSLLDRVVNGIAWYLEKNGLENSEAESSRDSLLNMLRQAKYILQDSIAPRKEAGRTYEAIYA